MLNVCKEDAPVSVTEECVFVQAIKRRYGCVYVSVIINQISSRQLLVSAFNESAYERQASRCMSGCASKIKREYGWLYVFVIFTLQWAATCMCMYKYVNTVELLRLHKAVILLLIMKYFLLKNSHIHSHTITPCNFIQ